MTICFYVPGTLASEMFRADDQGGLIWVHAPSLILGQFGCLRLAPDGIAPGPPDGLPCSPGGPLIDYDGPAVASLVRALGDDGYSIVPFGWDWRKHFFEAGLALAAAVRSLATADDPCSIVAHSAGGLVAKAAWGYLVSTGDQERVRRIITLATPYQGTYFPVAVWSGGPEDIYQLVSLSTGVGGSIYAFTGGRLGRLWDAPGVATLAASWPLLYDLLPVLGSPDSADDPLRGQVFTGSNWVGSVRPNQIHLDYSKDVVGPWQLNPATFPPPWILTTLAGEGYPTPAYVRWPSFLGRPDGYGSRDGGDGVVTTSSALVPASSKWTIQAKHVDIPTIVASSGWLESAVLEVRGPDDPPQPLRFLPDVDNLQMSGPPLTQSFINGPSPQSCLMRPCQC